MMKESQRVGKDLVVGTFSVLFLTSCQKTKQRLFFAIGLTFVLHLVGCGSGSQKDSGDDRSGGRSEKSFSGSSEESQRTGGRERMDGAGTQIQEYYDGVQIALGSSDDAAVEKAVAAVLSQSPGDIKALNSLGLYHLSKGRYPLARMIFNSMVDANPRSPTALNNLGVLYSQQKEIRQAIEHYRRALAVDSNYPMANANLGTIFASGRDFSKARPFLEKAYKGGIRDLALLNNYATALMADRNSAAEKVFREALQIGSSDPILNINYAIYWTYIKKDYKQASEILDKIRFMGVPAERKNILQKMEETISGRGSEEIKGIE